MARWQKKQHLVDIEVRLGAHSLPPGQHILEGDYWAQFTDVLERAPEVAPTRAAAPPLPSAPTPPPVAPTAPIDAPAPSADAPDGSAGAAHSDGDDRGKKKGKGR